MNHSLEKLAGWLQWAARDLGHSETFRQIIRNAAEAAAELYGDDDELEARALIGSFAAAVDEYKRDFEEHEGSAGLTSRVPDLIPATVVVPEDHTKPGFDVLMGKIGTRTHYIHNAMASSVGPISAAEIGSLAGQLAKASGYEAKASTFSPEVTRNHLVSMRDKPGRNYAEQVDGGRWQLTQKARLRIAAALG